MIVQTTQGANDSNLRETGHWQRNSGTAAKAEQRSHVRGRLGLPPSFPGFSRSASRKGQQRRHVAGVCSLQGGDVIASDRGGVGEVAICQAAAPPTEARLAQAFDEQVGHHPGLASVAIGKGVDGHEAMMEADGDFIGRKGGMVDLVAHVVEQFFELNTDVEPIDTDVLVGLAKLAGPLPGFAEHLAMELAQKAFAENFLALFARPLVALADVELFPLVEFCLRR